MQSVPSRSDLCIVTARVRHYQRLSETPVKAWVAVKYVGTVLCVHNLYLNGGIGRSMQPRGCNTFYDRR